MNIDKNWNLPSYLHLVYIYIVSEYIYMYIYIYCKCNNQILQHYIYPPIYLLIYLSIYLSTYTYLSFSLSSELMQKSAPGAAATVSQLQQLSVSWRFFCRCILMHMHVPGSNQIAEKSVFWKALVVFQSHVWTAVRIRNVSVLHASQFCLWICFLALVIRM